MRVILLALACLAFTSAAQADSEVTKTLGKFAAAVPPAATQWQNPRAAAVEHIPPIQASDKITDSAPPSGPAGAAFNLEAEIVKLKDKNREIKLELLAFTPLIEKLDGPQAKEQDNASLCFNLAVLYWTALGTAFLVALVDKLVSNLRHAEPQVLSPAGPAVLVKPAPCPRAAVVMQAAVVEPVEPESSMVTKESNKRSLVKSVVWRSITAVITMCTSYIFTKSFATGYAIILWDLCTKWVTMFVSERLWNRVNWGRRSGGGDMRRRSFVKCLLKGCFTFATSLVAAGIVTQGKMGVSGKIATTNAVVKTTLFYFYERFWAGREWGRQVVYSSEKTMADSSKETSDQQDA